MCRTVSVPEHQVCNDIIDCEHLRQRNAEVHPRYYPCSPLPRCVDLSCDSVSVVMHQLEIEHSDSQDALRSLRTRCSTFPLMGMVGNRARCRWLWVRVEMWKNVRKKCYTLNCQRLHDNHTAPCRSKALCLSFPPPLLQERGLCVVGDCSQ